MPEPQKLFDEVKTSRQIIENKLLTALEDVATVALLASKEDLDILIVALSRITTRSLELLREYGQHKGFCRIETTGCTCRFSEQVSNINFHVEPNVYPRAQEWLAAMEKLRQDAFCEGRDRSCKRS